MGQELNSTEFLVMMVVVVAEISPSLGGLLDDGEAGCEEEEGRRGEEEKESDLDHSNEEAAGGDDKSTVTVRKFDSVRRGDGELPAKKRAEGGNMESRR
jgi:hypothetical protein